MTPVARAAALLATAVIGLAGVPAQAAADGTYAPLKHPQPVTQTDTREVVEFFWYGCSHSQALEQPLEDWIAKQPKDVVLRRIPVVWSGAPDQDVERAHARLYYTLERLGQVDRLQLAVFQAVRDQGADLTTEDAAAQWAEQHQVDRGRFAAAYESPEVAQEVDRAPQEMARYEVNEIPAAIVQGANQTTPSRAGGAEQMVPVVDQLVSQLSTQSQKHQVPMKSGLPPK
ncbi:thiol:disulfide interchange protein DsbA/DsbL [Kitasatospora sp. RB6PN24]|uniref:thiol:disulfide interchange protein DsbA/DsbL n=1 Tax=Kitasatospora humi TaxID=2893891 RepID=UPI001E5DCE9E|nr:thiol:disulfide interchange protein DsbA/DsbL [Kitasatospora humi]MCC9310161.1 thiol:disulfide interchange protein DsbA/DsbL [Kitasatospora humi]